MKRRRDPLATRIRDLKLLLLDIDGVLTDGRISYGPRGEELKTFHVHDGLGIQLLDQAGIRVGFLSSRRSPAAVRRARELKVRIVRTGVPDKLKTYESIRKQLRLRDSQIGYVGDDLPDLPVLRRVGFPFAVKGSDPEVSRAALYTTRTGGGRGAVREIARLILKQRSATPPEKSRKP